MNKSDKNDKHHKININVIIYIPTPMKYSRNVARISKKKDVKL
jgi:hypothetical protein